MIMSKFVWKNPDLPLSEKKTTLEMILKDAEEIVKDNPMLAPFMDAVKEEHLKIMSAIKRLN